MRKILAVLATLVVVAALGGIAQAALTSDPITACANKSNGVMRLLSSGSCKAYETPVTWNSQGEPGTPGTDGTDGVSGYEIVTNDKVPGLGFLGEGAFCPTGKRVLGGGAVPIDDNGIASHINTFNILDSSPVNEGTAWSVTWTLSSNPFAENVRVYAICATV